MPEGYHKYFAEWSERDVIDFVRRDRNHPSVVLWSAGNEIGEQSWRPTGPGCSRRLLDIFHREDPTRPVTTGNDNIAADRRPATLAFLNTLRTSWATTTWTAGRSAESCSPSRTARHIPNGG